MKSYWSSNKARFFQESAHTNLSICRIGFYLFIIYIHFYLLSWTKFSLHPEFYKANGIFQLINLSEINQPTYLLFWYISLIFSFFSMIGLLSRTSFFVTALLFCILNSLPQNYQSLVGLNTINTLILFIFCFTKAGDHYSVDYIIRKKFSNIEKKIISAEYSWPIYYFRFIHILCYFFAGLSKLRDSGINWAVSNNLKYEAMCSLISRNDASWKNLVPINWLDQLINFDIIFLIGAIFILTIELLSPLILFYKKFRFLILVPLVSMHILSFFILLIDPTVFIGAFIFWIDWSSLIRKISRN
jgi:hypothetical protein